VAAIGGFLGGIFALRRKIVNWLKKSLDFERIQAEIDQLRSEVIQNRLLTNIHNTPEKVSVIEADYKTYSQLGGNGYMREVYDQWKAMYEHPIVKGRFAKKKTKKVEE
jgi:hypothetical protein